MGAAIIWVVLRLKKGINAPVGYRKYLSARVDIGDAQSLGIRGNGAGNGGGYIKSPGLAECPAEQKDCRSAFLRPGDGVENSASLPRLFELPWTTPFGRIAPRKDGRDYGLLTDGHETPIPSPFPP